MILNSLLYLLSHNRKLNLKIVVEIISGMQALLKLKNHIEFSEFIRFLRFKETDFILPMFSKICFKETIFKKHFMKKLKSK